MSDLAKILGNSGEPHAIVHDGKTYRFRLIDQVAKDAVAKRLYQRARDAVYLDRDHLTSEEYQASLDRVRDRYESGQYGFYTKRTCDLLQTPTGVMLILSILSGENEESLVPLIASRPEEVNVVLKTIFAESFPKRGEKAPPEAAANA